MQSATSLGPQVSIRMSEPHDVDLANVLRDPSLPPANVRRGQGFQYRVVWRVVALAEARLGSSSDMERQIDAFVNRVGGRRVRVLDPWRGISSVVRRARGDLPPLREDLYELPESFFGSTRGTRPDVLKQQATRAAPGPSERAGGQTSHRVDPEP